MLKESCTLCGVSPVVQPDWRKNGRVICADCLEMAITTLDNQPPEAVIPAAPGVLGRLVTLCTFCERRGPHHVLVRTSRGRICDRCINEARVAVPAWVYAQTPLPPWPPAPGHPQRLTDAIETIPDPQWRTILQQCWGLAGDAPDLETLHAGYFEDRSRLWFLRHLRHWKWVIDQDVRKS